MFYPYPEATLKWIGYVVHLMNGQWARLAQ